MFFKMLLLKENSNLQKLVVQMTLIPFIFHSYHSILANRKQALIFLIPLGSWFIINFKIDQGAGQMEQVTVLVMSMLVCFLPGVHLTTVVTGPVYRTAVCRL